MTVIQYLICGGLVAGVARRIKVLDLKKINETNIHALVVLALVWPTAIFMCPLLLPRRASVAASPMVQSRRGSIPRAIIVPRKSWQK